MNGVERIDLGNGQWWDIYTVCSRGMRKAFRKAGLNVLGASLSDGLEIDLTDPDSVRRAAMAHPDALNLDAIDDAYLVHGTHAWSFEVPFGLEAIDRLEDGLVGQVLGRMQELYAEQTEEARKNS